MKRTLQRASGFWPIPPAAVRGLAALPRPDHQVVAAEDVASRDARRTEPALSGELHGAACELWIVRSNDGDAAGVGHTRRKHDEVDLDAVSGLDRWRNGKSARIAIEMGEGQSVTRDVLGET